MRQVISARSDDGLSTYRVLALVAACVLIGYLLGSVTRAPTVPGLDPPEDLEPVTISFEPFNSTEPPFFLVGPIDPADFEGGDRQSYDCAFIELTDGSEVEGVVTFERTALNQADGSQYVQVNDRGIVEVSDGHPKGPGAADTDGDLCGEPDTSFVNSKGQTITVKGLAVYDNSDHFPHMIHPGDGLQFYQDGVPTSFLDLSTDQCDRWYFTPGDEPGEFWLWDDEDGPTGGHSHDVNDLPCGGGPEEPEAIARVYVDFAQADVGYCTVTFHETSCAGMTEPSPSPSPSPSPGPCGSKGQPSCGGKP